MENDKKDIKYRVIINNEDFVIEEGKNPDLLEDICESELVFEKDNLKSIDIIPVIEGSDNMMSIITIVVGIALIWTGVGAAMAAGGLASMTAMQGAMIIGGIGLVAAGVTNLMTPMPKFGDFREIEGGGAQSYTFAGPQNTIREGGPVFVGYGRLLIGSHVIQSALDTVDTNAEVQPQDTWGETKYGLFYNIPNAGGLLETQTQNWNN
jgi:predicted phage tail protein